MTSLKKRVTTYLRQLSFHNETRGKSNVTFDAKTFVIQALKRNLNDHHRKKQLLVASAKEIKDMPVVSIGAYELGDENVTGSCTGPDRGILTLQEVPSIDTIDFIDTAVEDSRVTTHAPSTSSINDWWPLFQDDGNNSHVYGRSDSLYDFNLVERTRNGDPIADCYAAITRTDAAIMALADGVNWGEKASIAAKSAVYGSVQHIKHALFDSAAQATHSGEVFEHLLQSLRHAHRKILENNGMLTTLTVLVALPITTHEAKQFLRNHVNINFNNEQNAQYLYDFSKKLYVCCVCNVGDSFAYAYSLKNGFREITEGSHNLQVDRDVRDALGALGPVEGTKPNLSNLTFSLTIVQSDDLLLLVSDGLSDNFDPAVCGITAPIPKIHDKGTHNIPKNQIYKRAISAQESTTAKAPQLSRSRTQLEMVRSIKLLPRDSNGLILASPLQRHYLAMSLMEHVLLWNCEENAPLPNVQTICDRLIEFTFRQTAEKRRTFEDPTLYYDCSVNGIRTELTPVEKRRRRRKRFFQSQNIAGKLDHVTALAVRFS